MSPFSPPFTKTEGLCRSWLHCLRTAQSVSFPGSGHVGWVEDFLRYCSSQQWPWKASVYRDIAHISVLLSASGGCYKYFHLSPLFCVQGGKFISCYRIGLASGRPSVPSLPMYIQYSLVPPHILYWKDVEGVRVNRADPTPVFLRRYWEFPGQHYEDCRMTKNWKHHVQIRFALYKMVVLSLFQSTTMYFKCQEHSNCHIIGNE